MRETLVTNCEKKFLLQCLSEFTRLDGRAFNEFRDLDIQFGKDWGCCYVSLGKTRVLAQTSCEIQQPKSSRPSEGLLNVNVELHPLAAPHFEPTRPSDLSVQLNRLLEKCVKDSKAIDLESLCIKMKEKVWALRVDINTLNHEGNLLDCASVALLASLAHFRRPDVTCDGEEFIIHSHKQRDPIPTVLHHYPICITYTIFNGGEYILADPNLLEEGVADAVLTVGLNGFKELCALHLGGRAELTPETIISTVRKSSQRANLVIEQIKEVVRKDSELREDKLRPVGFHKEMVFNKSATVDLASCLDEWQSKTKRKKQTYKAETMEIQEVPETKIERIGKHSAEFIPKDEENMIEIDSSSEDDGVMIVDTPKKEKPIRVLGSDSEEESVVILENI